MAARDVAARGYGVSHGVPNAGEDEVPLVVLVPSVLQENSAGQV